MQSPIFPSENLSQQSLNRLTEEIIALWESRVREEVVSAAEILRPTLRNALPQFLHFLAQALSEKHSRGLLEAGSDLVRQHAEGRARESEYAPAEIVQEFQVLREIVTSHLEQEINLSPKDYETIQKTFDQTIQEALMEFFLVHTKLREQFTATLSHDLRNPLHVASLGAQLILRNLEGVSDTKTREEIKQLATRIAFNLKRADRLIQDLLDASVLRLGKTLPVQIKHCDLFTVIQDVVSEVEEKERSRIVVEANSTQGFWDCERLKRAIENLVKNAIKYGETTTPIAIKLTHKNERVQISVHNFGEAIPEADHESIFQAFRRSYSTPVSTHEGWGIGLALVRAVSESLGGTVKLTSNPTEGTTFTIDILKDARPL